ncbi:MAG: alpha-L-rhamnosidase, partial [Solirubrobacteraceae bacterium]
MGSRSWLGLVAVVATALLLAGAAGSRGAEGTAPGAPAHLTVGDRVRPLNVEGEPLFGRLPRDADGNEVQTAYQLRVWRERDDELAWDSGKVASTEQQYVR